MEIVEERLGCDRFRLNFIYFYFAKHCVKNRGGKALLRLPVSKNKVKLTLQSREKRV